MKIPTYREGRNLAKVTWIISVSSVTGMEVGWGLWCTGTHMSAKEGHSHSVLGSHCHGNSAHMKQTHAKVQLVGALAGDPWKNGGKYKNTTVSLIHLDTHGIIPTYFLKDSLLLSSLHFCSQYKIWLLCFPFFHMPWKIQVMDGGCTRRTPFLLKPSLEIQHLRLRDPIVHLEKSTKFYIGKMKA